MKPNDTVSRIVLALIIGLTIGVIAFGTALPDRLEAFGKWQGLMGGAFTLLAAGFAANYVVAQIRHAQEIEEGRLARSRRAWLAMMPEAMSEICEYAEKSYRALLDLHAIAMQPTALTVATNTVLTAPEFDRRVFPDIRAMIEVASPSETDAYVELLSQIQVHRARWRGRLQRLSSPHGNVLSANLEVEMVYAAELYARASNLLGAARPNATPEDLKPLSRSRALYLLGNHYFPIPAVGERAEQWDETRPLPVP